MDLELHGEIRAAPTPLEVTAAARELEEDGYDGALVLPFEAEEWPAAEWALAATSRLRIAVAHRAGTPVPADGRFGTYLSVDAGSEEHLSLLTRPLTLGGASPRSLQLAARHAQVYDVPPSRCPTPAAESPRRTPPRPGTAAPCASHATSPSSSPRPTRPPTADSATSSSTPTPPPAATSPRPTPAPPTPSPPGSTCSAPPASRSCTWPSRHPRPAHCDGS
ncbi:hypothetical protein [Kitasatospora cheerisanensis]|uniref:hypothetical protein n=1 Tax=Kitasatospora cheerisanensis TaxID=81942 RepID=UPI001FCAD783|nr:hypothetical protein [Kitasatospora cheerisanensis]